MKYWLPVALVLILAALFTLVVVSAIAYRADEAPRFSENIGWVEVFEPPPILSAALVSTNLRCTGGFNSIDRLQNYTDLLDGAISGLGISHVRYYA